VADTLEGQLDAFRQKTSNSREAPTVSLDEDQQAKLASLGYFADNAPAGGKSSSTNPTGTDPKSVDPKDRVEISNTLHRVQLLVQALHYDEAVALLEQVIQKEPEQFIAYATRPDLHVAARFQEGGAGIAQGCGVAAGFDERSFPTGDGAIRNR